MMIITVSVVCRIRCGRRGFDRSRCRGCADQLRKRLRMIVVAIVMSDAQLVVIGFGAGRRMVAVLQTRSHSYSCRGSDHGAGAEEHNHVAKPDISSAWWLRYHTQPAPITT